MASKTILGTALVAIGVTMAGCADEHALVASTTSDLACEPSALRSVWWSGGAGPFYGGTGEIVVNAAGTHLLIEDLFRSTSVRLSDGARSSGEELTVDLTDVSGVRFATQRMTTDAEGRSDYASVTDVYAVGTPTPLAGIPWIVPRDATGSTQVIAHVSQTGDRAYLVERATQFDGTEQGLWLRSIRVSSPSDEARLDLTHALDVATPSYEAPFSILVDEAHGVVFVAVGRQVPTPPSIARIEIASGAVTTEALTLDPNAPLLGLPAVGDPGALLLEVALTNDGSELYVTTRDGRLRVLDSHSLAEIRAGARVGVVVANAETYLPSLRSPVASSSHDRLIAMLDETGAVVIADAASMTTRATLHSAAPPVSDHELGGPRPIALRFLSDGLVVVTDAGVERYRCP